MKQEIETTFNVHLNFKYLIRSKINKINERTAEAIQNQINGIIASFHSEEPLYLLFNSDNVQKAVEIYLADDHYLINFQVLISELDGLDEFDENNRLPLYDEINNFFNYIFNLFIKDRAHLFFDEKENTLSLQSEKLEITRSEVKTFHINNEVINDN